MRYVGGPKDGEEIEPEHIGADEVRIVMTWYSEEHDPLETQEHLYMPDTFGRMVHQKRLR